MLLIAKKLPYILTKKTFSDLGTPISNVYNERDNTKTQKSRFIKIYKNMAKHQLNYKNCRNTKIDITHEITKITKFILKNELLTYGKRPTTNQKSKEIEKKTEIYES